MKKKYEIPWFKEIEIEDVLTSSAEKNDNTEDDFADDGFGSESDFFEIFSF